MIKKKRVTKKFLVGNNDSCDENEILEYLNWSFTFHVFSMLTGIFKMIPNVTQINYCKYVVKSCTLCSFNDWMRVSVNLYIKLIRFMAHRSW